MFVVTTGYGFTAIGEEFTLVVGVAGFYSHKPIALQVTGIT